MRFEKNACPTPRSSGGQWRAPVRAYVCFIRPQIALLDLCEYKLVLSPTNSGVSNDAPSMSSIAVVHLFVHPSDLCDFGVMQRPWGAYSTCDDGVILCKDKNVCDVMTMGSSITERVLYDRIVGLLQLQFQTVQSCIYTVTERVTKSNFLK